MLIFGHRGAAGLAAENTLPSFRLAAELGCHGIECDIWAVGGQAVVIHDGTADRTTPLRGRIHELGSAALHVAGVPFLSELAPLLAEFPALQLNVELKEVAAAPLLAAWWAGLPPALAGRVLASSFAAEALAHPTLVGRPRALCIEGDLRRGLAQARWLGCAAVHPDHRLLDAAAVAGAGLPLRAWTVNAPERARQLARWGVAALFTDRPDLLLKLPKDSASCGADAG